MKWNFTFENLSHAKNLSGHINFPDVIRSVMPNRRKKEWLMKQVTRFVHANEAHPEAISRRTEDIASEISDELSSESARATSIQNYVDEVGHHQTYAHVAPLREPSLNRLSKNIEQLEMMNSRLEFMMSELSSTTRRFRKI